MSDQISLEDFVFGVLSNANEVFGEDAIYIKKTRAMKIVCLTADYLGFYGLPRGFYRYGHYSFQVADMIRPYFRSQEGNLLIADIPTTSSFDNYYSRINEFLVINKKNFIQERDMFYNWIHYKMTPTPYDVFYKIHNELYEALNHILEPSRKTLAFEPPYTSVGEIITRYNLCLSKISPENRDIFFKFTDILENLLLVSKIRNIGLNDLAHILNRLKKFIWKISILALFHLRNL
jgi:hypothetical protein